jgi:transcriptional regulator with XRE-family HTH domain
MLAGRNELVAYVKEEIKNSRLRELSKSVGVSKSYLSMYASGKYERDWRELEEKIRLVLPAANLSFRDRRRLTQIEEILSDADDRSTLFQTIAVTFSDR